MGGLCELSEAKQSTTISYPRGCFRFPICCPISKSERVKGDWCKPNFGFFDPRKNLGGVGKMRLV